MGLEGRSTNIEDECLCLEGFYEDPESEECRKCEAFNCKECDEKGDCKVCNNSDLMPPLCEES